MSTKSFDWGDLLFDQSTISDLTTKEEDPVDLQTQLVSLMNSNDPLNDGVFAEDIANAKTGPLVTGENLFGNIRANDDDNDEDEAQLHALLTGTITNKRKDFRSSQVAQLSPSQAQLPSFLQEQSQQLENIKLTEIGLGSLELSALRDQYRVNTLFSTTNELVKTNQNNDNALNLGSLGVGYRTDTGYVIASREELLHKMRAIVLNIAELCYLSEPEAESLLRFYQWDVSKLQNEWVTNTNQTRLRSGVWRQVDSSCYLFGIGCLSSFLTTSSLFTSQNTPSVTPRSPQQPGDITSTQFVGNSSLFSWNDLVGQVFQYYQSLYFEKKKTSKQSQITNQHNEGDENLDTIGPNIIMPDSSDHSLISMHSSALANEFRGSYKFIGQAGRHSHSHSHNGMNFPGLTDELTYENPASMKMRSNSISFSRLDVPLQLLYFTHAKTEFSLLLYTLVKCFHFPQEVNLTEELHKLQQNFIQFFDSTKSLSSPLMGLQNTSEFYSIELQEQLHGLRQVLQVQDKCCPHAPMVSSPTCHHDNNHNHHNRGLLNVQQILDTHDLPPLTTSLSLIMHNTLQSVFAPSQPSSSQPSSSQRLSHLFSEDFFKYIIIPLDNLLLSFTNPSISISPQNISRSLNTDTHNTAFIFSYLQQHMWFSEQNQIASAMATLCPQVAFAKIGDSDDPFGLKAMEAAAGVISNNANSADAGDSNFLLVDDADDIPEVLQEFSHLMHPSQIALWNDILVDESDVIQISPFVFNLPHHSLSETKFYLKIVDFKLLYSILAYQKIDITAISDPKHLFPTSITNKTTTTTTNMAINEENNQDDYDFSKDYYWFDPVSGECVSSEPQLDDIFELFRQTDYYAKFSAYRQHRDSLLPPGKQFGNVHIPSFFQPTLYVQCSTAYCNIIRLDHAFALGCGHYFCKDCWTTNLRSCLTEKGREAALIECMGGEYSHEKQAQSEEIPSQDGALQPTIDAMTASLTTLTLNFHPDLTQSTTAPTQPTTTTTTTTTTAPAPPTRQPTLQGKLTKLLSIGRNKMEDIDGDGDRDRDSSAAIPTISTQPPASSNHPLQPYRIVGKCHSVVPMSFLFRIISPTFVPATSSPALSSVLNPTISPQGVLRSALDSQQALSILSAQYFHRVLQRQQSTLQQEKLSSTSSSAHHNSELEPQLLQPTLSQHSSNASQRSFKPQVLVQQGSSSFFTKQENGMATNNQSVSNLFATNPTQHNSNNSSLSSIQRTGSNNRDTAPNLSKQSTGLILPTQPLETHNSLDNRLSFLEPPSLIERNSTLLLSRANTLQLSAGIGSGSAGTGSSNGTHVDPSRLSLNALSLFPAPLHNQSSLRRYEIDRIHDSAVLQQAQQLDTNAVKQIKKTPSVGRSHLALLAATQYSKQPSLSGSAQSEEKLLTANPTALQNEQQSSTKTTQLVLSTTDPRISPSNPHKLAVSHIQELSPNDAYLLNVQTNKSVFVPRLSPSFQYNKLLWWILDIFVDKSPYIKWCPNPLCDSYAATTSHSSPSSAPISETLQDETLPMKAIAKTKEEIEQLKVEKDQTERSPYAFIFVPAFQPQNNPTYHVDCLCGKSICFRCLDESHSPSPCDLFKKWKSATGDKSNEIWLSAKTKACPKCHVLIEKNKACNHMTCTCRHEFCWLCLQSWSGHSSSFSCSTYAQQSKQNHLNATEEKVRLNASLLTKLEYYGERYKQHTQGIDFCVYLQKVLSISLPRASNFILHQIVSRCSNSKSGSTWSASIGNYSAITGSSSSAASPTSEKAQQELHQFQSVRLKAARASLDDRSRLNIFNLDLAKTVNSFNGSVGPQQSGAQYRKWISDGDCLPYYYSNFTDLGQADITKKQLTTLNTSSPTTNRSSIRNEDQYPDLHSKFDFIYTALETLIKTRKVLQYAYIVAYYLKTSTDVKFNQGSSKPIQSKSQKQLFELQLRYLVEPTEKLQSYLDYITEDLTYVFFHKRVILELCTAIDKLRKFLLQHVSTDQDFEEALLYEADVDMTRDIWLCVCGTEHPLSDPWCKTCLECRIHREPECKICGSQNY